MANCQNFKRGDGLVDLASDPTQLIASASIATNRDERAKASELLKVAGGRGFGGAGEGRSLNSEVLPLIGGEANFLS